MLLIDIFVFTREAVSHAQKGGCPNMGHYADKFKDKIKNDVLKLYLNTGEARDFPREFWMLPLLHTLCKNFIFLLDN